MLLRISRVRLDQCVVFVTLIIDEMRCAANVANDSVSDPQLAHLPRQIPLAFHGLVGSVLLIELVIVLSVGGHFLFQNGLSDVIEAVAGAYPPHDLRDVILGSIQDGLDEDLES